MAKRLDLESLAVDSFEPVVSEHVPDFAPIQPGGAQPFYIAPGHTDRSCTYCTFVGLLCC